jgi:hypothetical protein
MEYRIIPGTFHVKGYQPDGDSIRFAADDPAVWSEPLFARLSAAERTRNRLQLRLEAIDSLETHYEGLHQPRNFGVAALDALLEVLGITNVKYNVLVTTIVDAQDGAAGFIATAGLDGFRRPISYAFPASAPLAGKTILPGGQLPLARSVNLRGLERGLVYPTLYSTMDRDLLPTFQKATQRARKAGRGLWAIDRTAGFTCWESWTIQQDVVILPKLFRRLVQFMSENRLLDDLAPWMRANLDDRVLDLATNTTVKLVDLLKFDATRPRRIGLPNPIETLLFVP